MVPPKVATERAVSGRATLERATKVKGFRLAQLESSSHAARSHWDAPPTPRHRAACSIDPIGPRPECARATIWHRCTRAAMRHSGPVTTACPCTDQGLPGRGRRSDVRTLISQRPFPPNVAHRVAQRMLGRGAQPRSQSGHSRSWQGKSPLQERASGTPGNRPTFGYCSGGSGPLPEWCKPSRAFAPGRARAGRTQSGAQALRQHGAATARKKRPNDEVRATNNPKHSVSYMQLISVDAVIRLRF